MRHVEMIDFIVLSLNKRNAFSAIGFDGVFGFRKITVIEYLLQYEPDERVRFRAVMKKEEVFVV